MDDKTVTNFIIEIKEKLGSIDTKVDSIRETMKNHETRITNLEGRGSEKTDMTWKEQLLMLLAKAILIGAVALGSLCGAGGILKEIIGTPQQTTIQQST